MVVVGVEVEVGVGVGVGVEVVVIRASDIRNGNFFGGSISLREGFYLRINDQIIRVSSPPHILDLPASEILVEDYLPIAVQFMTPVE